MRKLHKLFFAVFLLVILSNSKEVLAETQYSENVIPLMKNYTTPKGRASASSTINYSWTQAYRAFDHTTYNMVGWVSDNQTEGWLEYDFEEPKIITKYILIQRNQTSRGEQPKDWTFEAYDENINEWVVLDTQTDITNWNARRHEYTFHNNKDYERYRINVSSNNGAVHIGIGELEMMETISSIPDSKIKVVLGVDESIQLSVNEDLSESTNVMWSSSDVNVASVNRDGQVIALSEGNTIIAVTSEDGLYMDFINVLVVPADKVKEYRLAVDLKVGSSCRLTVDDVTDTVKVDWSSLDSSVATITNNGRVTAVSEGLTIIVVTNEKGTEIGQIYIRVRE